MGPMTYPRTSCGWASPETGSGREAAMERSYEFWRYERLVMGWVGIILLLVMTLIVALSEDFGASLVGWSGGSTGYFQELYGSGPEWR